MTRSQRQNQLDKFFAGLARAFALRRGLSYAGTLRRLPPPPFPGTAPESTRYFVNALFPDEGVTRLVEMDDALRKVLEEAERWVDDGRGPAPKLEQIPRIVARGDVPAGRKSSAAGRAAPRARKATGPA